MTTAFYEGAHYGIQRAIGRGWWRTPLNRAATAAFDWYTMAIPFADAWLHEEYHRAGLSRRGIASANGTYAWVPGATMISVDRIRDEDLVRLKRDHPTEFSRLAAAGIEGEYELVRQLQRGRFFRDGPTSHVALYWLTKLNTIAYIMSGTDPEDEAIMQLELLKEGTDPSARDVVGHDFLSWVYDLHRPDEPYTARRAHPSGVGIDRYIALSDLTPRERAYLERQGRLSVLNLFDPALYGVTGVTLWRDRAGEPLRLNLALGHQLTSFGHTVSLTTFVRHGDARLYAVLNRYENGVRRFAGVDVRALDWPVSVHGRALRVSPRLALWSQPATQRHVDAAGTLGGLAALRVDHGGTAGDRVGTFAEVEGKTAGWVSGNVYLDRNVSLRVGLTTAFYPGR